MLTGEGLTMSNRSVVTVDRAHGKDFAPVDWRIPGLTVEFAWRVLRGAFAQASGHGAGPSAKLLRNGLLVTDPDRWPHITASPTGLEEWVAAMGPDPYLAWARSVQTVDRALFEVLVEAMATEFRRRGLPSGSVEAELFLGDYPHTPGGIHREACSNIHLVLWGTKSMYFWNPSQWPPPEVPRRVEVAVGNDTHEEYLPEIDEHAVLAAADSLKAEAGAGFSWQAGTWHVGQAHGPALALNIAAYHRGFDTEPSMRDWSEETSGAVSLDWLDRYSAHVGGNDSPAVLLARVSALGMRPAPPTRRPQRGPRGRWRLGVPLLWTTTTGYDLLVATLGAVRRQERTPVALGWLGERHDVGTVSEVPDELEGLAAWLHEQGSFEIISDDPSITHTPEAAL